MTAGSHLGSALRRRVLALGAALCDCGFRSGVAPWHRARQGLLVLLTLGLLLGLTGDVRSKEGRRFELPPEAFPPLSIQFPTRPLRLHERFVTAKELRVWARNRNLELVDDCGLGGLRDGVASVIPSTGMEFELAAPGRGRVFLYLDLVSFRPLGAYRPYFMKLCDTGPDQAPFPEFRDVQMERPLWLEVSVNGHVLKTLYQGGGTYLHSPIRITVDRQVPIHRRMKVRLLPSPGDSFFAIWDVVASTSPDEPADG